MDNKPYKYSIDDWYIAMEIEKCHNELLYIQETLNRKDRDNVLFDETSDYEERKKELVCEIQSLEDLLKKK